MEWEEFSIVDLEALVSPEIFKRGLDYYQEGHLLKACRVEKILAGKLIGTGGIYNARLWFTDAMLEVECSCPFTGFCKHLVALALGWINNRSEVYDLQPELLRVQEDPALLRDLFQQLIEKDPLNLLELISQKTPDHQFITARGLTNLIRNAFTKPWVTTAEIESTWDKLTGIQSVLNKKLKTGDLNAMLPLEELLKALVEVLEDSRSEILVGFCNTLLNTLSEISCYYTPESFRPVFKRILKIYFESSLWDLKAGIREVIIEFSGKDPEFLVFEITARINEESSLPVLIGLYELLPQITKNNKLYIDYFERVLIQLKLQPEGRLWLIDRLEENDADQAFKLAKEGQRCFEIYKSAFRDRLITLHQKRNELKQAASLSFIQFQEEPNFEEYRRLKRILSENFLDWQSYYHRLTSFLANRNEQLLLIQIFIDQRDYEGIHQNLAKILADESLLLQTARLFILDVPPDLAGIYQLLIKGLLMLERSSSWKAALELLRAFKKSCFLNDKMEGWRHFQAELAMEYQDDPNFDRKFGTILS